MVNTLCEPSTLKDVNNTESPGGEKVCRAPISLRAEKVLRAIVKLSTLSLEPSTLKDVNNIEKSWG